jgi:hypothetical protein
MNIFSRLTLHSHSTMALGSEEQNLDKLKFEIDYETPN